MCANHTEKLLYFYHHHTVLLLLLTTLFYCGATANNPATMDIVTPDSPLRSRESPEKKPSLVFHDEMVSPIHMVSSEVEDLTTGPMQELGDEVWGAKMFLQSVRTRLRSKKVFESHEMRANMPDRSE